jgi:hypothetical protein
LSKVANLPAIEAWKIAGEKLLWWPDGSLLWRGSRGIVELLLLLLRLLLLELPWLELWVINLILLLYPVSAQNSGKTDLQFLDSDWPKLWKSRILFWKATLSAFRWSIKRLQPVSDL